MKAKEIITAIREEYRNPPELRAALKLLELGLTQDDVQALPIPESIRCAIYNVMRDLERDGQYFNENINRMWIHSNRI